MAVAESHKVDPVRTVVQQLQRALDGRAQGLAWRSTPQGLVADVPEGMLLLTPLPEASAWKLTAVFQAMPTTGGPDATATERGRRVIGWGTLGRMQQRAHELAMGGVPGGPAYLGGDLAWYAVGHDQSLRMAVPDGELRISLLNGELCILTHEDVRGVELLKIGLRSELMEQALSLCLTRAARPLQIRVKGRRTNLGPIAVPGVLGYYEQKNGSLVVLVLVEGDILLLEVRGVFHRPLARLSWTDLLFGEAVEVQPACAKAGASVVPSSGLRVMDSGAATAESACIDVVRAATAPSVSVVAAASSQVSNAADDPASERAGHFAAHAPMNERHRALCQRYFRRLHQRLRGRGARKARALVLVLLEAFDWCREDITGSRTEVYALLECQLKRRLPGGPRNVRDCLDLLMHSSLFVRPGSDRQCTLLFGQLHDPDSELMRLIAAEDAREEAAANERPAAPPGFDAPKEEAAHPAPEPVEGSSAPVERSLPSPMEVLKVQASDEKGAVTSEVEIQHQRGSDIDPRLVAVFRQLGKAPGVSPEPPPEPPEPAPAPMTDSAPTPPRPQIFAPGGPGPAPRAVPGFPRAPTYFLGQPVDDDDETDAPSRYRGVDPDESPPFLD